MASNNNESRSLNTFDSSSPDTDEVQQPNTEMSPAHESDDPGTRQASSQAGNGEIGTPEALIELLHGALDTELFALDPAAGAQPRQIAVRKFEKKDDGLRTSWNVPGSSVYLNPPYSDPGPWLKRLTHFVQPTDDEKFDFGVALLKADPSTGWFQQHVSQATALCFPDKRLKFYEPETGEQMDAPPWPVVIALFGDPPQAIPESLSTGCEPSLFNECAIYTSVEVDSIGGQQTLTDLLSDGGVSVEEAMSDSPHWRKKPADGYSSNTSWYLSVSQKRAIQSTHMETRSPKQSNLD